MWADGAGTSFDPSAGFFFLRVTDGFRELKQNSKVGLRSVQLPWPLGKISQSRNGAPSVYSFVFGGSVCL